MNGEPRVADDEDPNRFRVMPTRIASAETVEEVESSATRDPDPRGPEPDRSWFEAGG
jgi:hypothetical protein